MQEISSKHRLEDLLLELRKVPEEIWGLYQFRRDLLGKKISVPQQKRFIKQAIACGVGTAKKIQKQYPLMPVSKICEQMEIPICQVASEKLAGRITFATYDETEGIRVMAEPLEKLKQLTGTVTSVSLDQAPDLILGHELFHHIETVDKEIYTRTTTIDLWRFLFYTHRSSIRALSEIAAMSFSKELNRSEFSPYLLDAALLWLYSQERSSSILSEVREIEQW
ncbi:MULTISPECIES: hypothetical protein [unclassified Enterococcus]|uniref:hypothetical protein n=1 Tax=unclassified Enterococcus TaxID=2608891 RepID=UPI0013EA7012